MQPAQDWLKEIAVSNSASTQKSSDRQIPLFFPEQSNELSPKEGPEWRRGLLQFSSPELTEKELTWIWRSLRRRYFPEKPELDTYRMRWSNRRQKRTLASCNVRLHQVNVARELNHPALYLWLDPLLYHEMCHAAIGFDLHQKGKRTPWHGKEFKALERRHPGIPELDRWIAAGGWSKAVRSHRSREAHRRRKRVSHTHG